MNLLCIVLFLFFSFVESIAKSSPIVKTSLGQIKGSIIKSRLGKDIYSFRGIRYANPPVGLRRFKVAESVHPWEGIFDASEDGPSCICPEGRNLSEDCLALNIYTTKLQNGNNGTQNPVIVFFPPGSFTSFSAQSYIWGPEYYLDQDIVLVTVNYRLSALGFTSTGTKHAPGNLGLKDQVMALKFIQQHIAHFGGNPNAVTITGVSAGGWSVVLHMLSPMSRGLFHKAIAMSGSPVKANNLPSNQSDIAFKQASFVNCPSGPDKLDEMFDCLGKVPAQQFGDTIPLFSEFYGDPSLIFSPVVEPEVEGVERFLHAQPVDIIRSGNFSHVPFITGITKDEIVRPVLRACEAADEGNSSYFDDLERDWNRVAPILFQYDRFGEQSETATTKIRKFYFNDEIISRDNADKLAQIYADAIIGFSVYRTANLMAQYSTQPVYYYEFAYQGRYSFQSWNKTGEPYGVAHYDDLQYIFYVSYLTPLFQNNDPETLMVEKMTSMWANFAKSGEPIPKNNTLFGDFAWETLTPKNHKYLKIDEIFEMRSKLFPERYALWDEMFPLSDPNSRN
ncbi:hypothetical protein QAD02_022710 [Eretmocerus hayati]|uniref:Uncharacterized protein n=1 Tax=Eretmocerus hayati TaxID=131215 RepID=A0ACC2PTR3_9HYME|nr:hypothetical protein QAD02_022710 [Eretmocerus hayati]